MLLFLTFLSFWCMGAAAPANERVLVTRVFDGDTIAVDRNGREETVRLIGVDTPETSRPETPVQFYGPEAAEYARRMLEGKPIVLEFEAADRPGGSMDKYGRTLAYVVTEDGKNFNRELVRLGYGRVFDTYPFRYLKEFRRAEREARTAGLGIWNEAKRAAWSSMSTRGRIVGNINSHLYHLPGQYGYDRVKEKNRIYFANEEEAIKAGFRKAKN